MSKQQTLFHHFLHQPKKDSPRRENGNATLHQPQNPTNWDNLDGNLEENLEDDVLLAACEDWEDSTLSSHLPSENGRTKPVQSYQESPGVSRHPFQQTIQDPVQQPMPEATLLEDLPGFDVSAGNIWIYPTNYPLREYQFNIVQQALFKNTMVSLPTGLGKTFVAAVVMYNFYRWYPEGKVVFMAPTKPLVAQQIEACHNIMGIPQSDMAEMTGNMPPSERQKTWNKCRVFFLTPQVLMNDLSRRVCPTQQVKCLVVDEAHKALGNHAYCQVVRELSKYSNSFRVLALSATPGSDLKAIQQVLMNLLISHIEIRSEDSIDIRPYVHERKVEKIVVPLDQELKSVRDKYLRVLTVYVSRLTNCGALLNKDPANLTQFQILQSRDAFRQDPPPQAKSRGLVEGDFALCISLYHGYELLLQHGLRSLHNFLQSTVDGAKGFSKTRQELMRNREFVQLLNSLREKFGSEDVIDGANRSYVFSSGGTQRVKEMKPYVTSHPKMAKLREIVLEHFRKFDAWKASPSTDQPSSSKGQQTEASSTRVMIFAQYRDSVNEIAEMLNRHRPLLRCMGFVGQASVGKNSKGISQKEQLRVVKEFREGGFNTLVCTCVGEEGLDIGDVDLIVCYDAHKSPIRLVQRMGRTGRKRKGRIVMLVTEGKEAAVYDRSQYNKKGIVKALQGNARSLQLYSNSPRMVPHGLKPVPHKMFIAVKAFINKKEAKRKSSAVARKSNETGLESFMAKGKSSKKGSEFLSPEELCYWSASYKLTVAERKDLPSMPESGNFVTLGATEASQNLNGKSSRPEMSLTEWAPWQMTKQPVRFVEHTQRCKHFVELMELIDLQNLTEGEDIYGLEMQTYLNEEDIVRPKNRIEQFCTVRTKRGTSVSDDVKVVLPKKDDLREPPSSQKGIQDEFLEGPATAQVDPGTKKQKCQPMDLISISSDSSHSDDALPAVLDNRQAHSEIQDSVTPTAAPKKTGALNQRTEKITCNNVDASKLSKPRKHKRKKKHLNPVQDSSDDDDFANTDKRNKLLGDKKKPSPNRRTKDYEDKTVVKNNLVDVKPDVFALRNTVDQGSRTPEAMDVDSDDFVFRKCNKPTESVPSEDPSNHPPEKTEEDLSLLFPTQSTFVTPAMRDEHLKPSCKNRKSVVPSPPPLSFSSLDLLDDIDTTFNLTQHFQSVFVSFGNTRKQNADATKPTQPETLHHDDTEPRIFHKSQTLNSGPQTLAMKNSLGAFTEKPEKESVAESCTSTTLCKEKILSSPFRPQFDLNADFMILSSDEECEASVKPTSDKMPNPFSPDGTLVIGKEHSNTQNPHIEREKATPQAFEIETPQPFDVETPQAFDVQTPQVQTPRLESMLKDTSSTTRACNDSLPTPVPSVKGSVQSKMSTLPCKASASNFHDTPKSGLETCAESRIFPRLIDKEKGASQTEKTKIGSRRFLNLKSQGSQNSMSQETSSILHTEDCAGIEKARLEVSEATEPQFDLGFDLDSLEDDIEEDHDIVPPSPDPGQQQEYISLSQKAKPYSQPCSSSNINSWTRTTSTPVSEMQSKCEVKTHSGILSPITADGKNTAHTDRVNKVPLNQSRSLSLNSNKRISMESFPSPKQRSGNGLEGDVVSELADDLSTPLVPATEPQFPSGTNIFLPVQDIKSLSGTKLSHRKRKSSPYKMCSSGCPTDAKRRKSEPASISSSPHLTKPADVEFCTEVVEDVQTSQLTMPDSPDVIVLDEDDHRGNKDHEDNEDDPLSQVVHPRKRHKAVALKSPETPIFRTPGKPSIASCKKTTAAKPLVSSSDDEIQSPLIQRAKKPRQIFMIEDDDNEFVGDKTRSTSPVSSMASFNNKLSCASSKQPKRTAFASGNGRDFLEEEVEVSNDEECSSDEGSDLDSSLDGFISHGSQPSLVSQSALTGDDMHAVYMQSVRSPKDGGLLNPSRNQFKMVTQVISEDLNVFSQEPVQDETYCENSFVVPEGDRRYDGKCREGEKEDHFDESLFENTINPDNILAFKRRPRRERISRAKQILKEGRRRVLMSSSSASTSTEETDEERKIPSRESNNSQKVATNRNPLTNCRTSKAAEIARPKKQTKHLQCRNPASLNSKDLVADNMGRQGNTSPNKGPASIIRQFLGGIRETNSCPDDSFNHRQTLGCNNSNRMRTQLANDGHTLAEKERAERLKRQEEKKQEFRRKMEEKKRLQQQNQTKVKQQEPVCMLKQPQRDGCCLNQTEQQNPLQHQSNPSAQLQQQQQQQLHPHHQQQQKTTEQCLNRLLQNGKPNLIDVPSSSSLKSSIKKTSGCTPTHKPVNPALKRTDKCPRTVPVRSPPLSPSSVQLMSRPTLAGCEEAMNRGKPVILIDTKELSSASHIVSTLALKHNLNPLVCPLTGCDYIVSSRMGVEKRTLLDFGNGANKSKLIDKMRHLCELFDRPCLILEKDRVKPGDNTRPRQLIRTKYFDGTLAALCKTHIKVFYSDSLEDTAKILADLVHIEARKGEGLPQPRQLDSTQEQILKFYLTLPRVSYATALSLLAAFPSVEQLFNSSREELNQKARISHQRAAEIVSFLQHQFDEQMTSLATTK